MSETRLLKGYEIENEPFSKRTYFEYYRASSGSIGAGPKQYNLIIKKYPGETLRNCPKLKEYYNKEVEIFKACKECAPLCLKILKEEKDESGNLYIIFENIYENSLREDMRRKKIFDEKEAFQIVIQLFLNLCSIKEKVHIILRNIKPEGIFFVKNKQNNEKEAVLSDLSSSILDDKSSRLKDDDGPVVSPYVSPEILASEAFDDKADVWSLGIIFYELLFGEVPFPLGDPYAMRKRMERGIREKPENDSVSHTTYSLLKNMLEPKSDKRISWAELQKKWKDVDINKSSMFLFNPEITAETNRIIDLILKAYKDQIFKIKLHHIIMEKIWFINSPKLSCIGAWYLIIKKNKCLSEALKRFLNDEDYMMITLKIEEKSRKPLKKALDKIKINLIPKKEKINLIHSMAALYLENEEKVVKEKIEKVSEKNKSYSETKALINKDDNQSFSLNYIHHLMNFSKSVKNDADKNINDGKNKTRNVLSVLILNCILVCYWDSEKIHNNKIKAKQYVEDLMNKDIRELDEIYNASYSKCKSLKSFKASEKND